MYSTMDRMNKCSAYLKGRDGGGPMRTVPEVPRKCFFHQYYSLLHGKTTFILCWINRRIKLLMATMWPEGSCARGRSAFMSILPLPISCLLQRRQLLRQRRQQQRA